MSILNLSKRVLVIGSGIAGLAAAQTLIHNGFEVKILEARADHGGRIRKNDTFGEFSIDIGGEEIHEVGCSYQLLAEKHGAHFKSDQELVHYFEDIDSEKLVERDAFIAKHKQSNFYNEIVDNYESLQASQSLFDFLKSKNIPESFYPIFDKFWAVENGGSLKEISVREYGKGESSYESDSSENLLISNMSNFDVFERIFAEVIPLIKYSTPIKQISYSVGTSTTPAIRIVDSKGASYEGDFIIVTVPISQLRNNSITFDPQLSQRKLDAISKIKLGRGGKLLLRFKRDILPKNTRNVILRSRIGFLWKAYNEKEFQSITIVCLIAGEIMEEMQDPIKQQVLLDELLDKMEKVLNIPNIREELEETMWTDFTKMEFIEGTYSLPTFNIGDSREVYQEPIHDVLYFAGEASHTKFALTMHGAYETGLRDANRIIKKVSEDLKSKNLL